MWVGGYDDWTPGEQREWDRDLAEREQREHRAKTDYEKIPTHLEEIHSTDRKDCKKKKQAFELAFEDPMYKAVFTPVVCTKLGETNAYIAELRAQPLAQEGNRNLVFEVVHPLYKGLNAILESNGPFVEQTTTIRIQVSSREHVDVSYTCYCTPDTFSYTVMDEILEGLNEQLSMKQNLNRGLLLQLSFIKKM